MLFEALKFISTQELLGTLWTPLREAQMLILCFYMHLRCKSTLPRNHAEFEHHIASASGDTLSLPSIPYFIAALSKLEDLQGS